MHPASGAYPARALPPLPCPQAASTIAAEVDALKAENAALLARRAALEEETRGARAALSTMQHQTDAAQGELDSMRQQAEIWRSGSSEVDKVCRARPPVRRPVPDQAGCTARHTAPARARLACSTPAFTAAHGRR
jgi:hypothetical protein